MDKSTGEVFSFATMKEFEEEQKRRIAAGEKPLEPIGCLPKASCQKCYGRGWIGRDIRTGEVIPCTCTQIKKSVRALGRLARFFGAD